jgi:hypothetical protein
MQAKSFHDWETNPLNEVGWFSPAARAAVIDDGFHFPFFVAVLEDVRLRGRASRFIREPRRYGFSNPT